MTKNLNANIFSYKCEKCDETLTPDDFLGNLLLYGFISLANKDNVIIGITCPNCNTVGIVKFKRNIFESIKQNLFFGLKRNEYTTDAYFKYQSFPYTFDFHDIEPTDIAHLYDIRLDYDVITIEEDEVTPTKKIGDSLVPNPVSDDLYCSYFFGDQAIGPNIRIYWFHEDNIDGLVKQENETDHKIFPRYIPYSPLYPAINKFCCDHYLDKNNAAENNLPCNFELIAGSTEGLLRRSADFVKILLTDYQYPVSTTKITEPTFDIEEAKKEILSGEEKGYGRDFLEKYYMLFIKEYIEISMKINSTFNDVYEIKNRYFYELYHSMSDERKSDAQYAFYEEPPTWTIKFEGKAIRGLSHNGFKHLYYLVSHKYKEFNVFELESLIGIPIETITKSSKNKDYDNNDSIHKDNSDSQTIADTRYVRELTEDINKLKIELSEAEREGDFTEQDRIKQEIEDHNEIRSTLTSPAGGLKRFKNLKKNYTDRIGANIRRALDELKNANEKAANHFKDSIKPSSNPIMYNPRPEEDFDWKL